MERDHENPVKSRVGAEAAVGSTGSLSRKAGFFLGRTITTGEIRGGYGSGPSEGETIEVSRFSHKSRDQAEGKQAQPHLREERKEDLNLSFTEFLGGSS